MSTTQGLARIVHEIDQQPVTWPTTPERVYLSDIETLCAVLEAEASVDLSDVTGRILQLSDAIRAGASTDISRYLDGGVWDLDPEELRLRVQDAARDRAVQLALAFHVSESFEMALVKDASAALTASADTVVTALRKSFDKAAKVVQAAVAAGITPTTDADSLSQSASHATIDAYRALGPAVVELNRIAGLRAKLTEVLHYGPFQPPVAPFVTGVPDQHAMQDAWNKWAGETETVQHNMPFVGSSLAQVPRPRLGGPWLALAVGGYQLRLNNAVETQAVIDHAHKAA